LDQASGTSGFTTYRCFGCSGTILDIAQTFTVGKSGKLGRVEVGTIVLNAYSVGSPAGSPLLFDIRPTVNGHPVADDAQALAVIALPASNIMQGGSVPPLVFDLSSFNIHVAQGQVLAFVLRSNGNAFSFATSDAGDVYSRGEYSQRFYAGDPFPTFTAPSFPQGTDMSFATYVAPEPVKVVDIDIKPGSMPNSVNSRSRGSVPVAILSKATFYAPSEMDVGSLMFGRGGDEASLLKCNPAGEDVNADGLLDLICHFDTQAAGFQSGDTQGVLSGETIGEEKVRGTDSVRIVR
jgi:hypothetical protein